MVDKLLSHCCLFLKQKLQNPATYHVPSFNTKRRRYNELVTGILLEEYQIVLFFMLKRKKKQGSNSVITSAYLFFIFLCDVKGFPFEDFLKKDNTNFSQTELVFYLVIKIIIFM